MNNASLIIPTNKMLAVGFSLACSFAYAGTEGYISTSTAAGYSDVGPTAVYAGQEGVQDSISARQAARRQAEAQAAMTLVQEGRSAYQEGRYSEALEKYREAWDRVPHAPATRNLQEFIRLSISDASIAVAIEYAKVGRYDDAEQLLLDVLSRDPKNARARKELSLLRDPVRNNPALTPEHVKNVDEVNRLLNLAYGYYEIGEYDKAYSTFNSVLKIDPYNEAARRGQETVSNRRSHYFITAHDSYRAKALAEVDATWEEGLPTSVEIIGGGERQSTSTVSERQIRINNALDSIRIARANFDRTPISEVVEFIRGEIHKSGDNSLNVNYQAPSQSHAAAPVAAASAPSGDEDEDEEEESAPIAVTPVVDTSEPEVTKTLSDLSLRELLEDVCQSANCVYVVGDRGINIYKADDPAAVVMETRVWRSVPVAFLSGKSDSDEDEDDEEDAFSSSKKPGGRLDPKKPLAAMGVNFPKGSSVSYSRQMGQLTMTNTPDNLDLVEDAIYEYRSKLPQMIKVTTKFVEVSQTNEEELSFDWVVNPFSMNNAGTTYLGGVSGQNATTSRTYDDFVQSGGTGYANNHMNNGSWPIKNGSNYASGSDTLMNGLVTGGNRSGSGALASSSLDTLISAGAPGRAASSNPAPGILSLSGIYDSGSFQMIMRGLSQKKGVDVMSAPSLVVMPDVSGEGVPAGPEDTRLETPIQDEGAARIEVVRRFLYPLAYDPPEIPNSTNNNNNNNNNNNGGMAIPVAAPANPNDFAVEEVGLVMLVHIKDEPENGIIKFDRFIVRVVDFEGFINYGSPIVSGIANNNTIEQVVLTDNRIDQPIFSRKMVNTQLYLFDGHTVAIGGMIEDKVQKVEDKVPVFGDLPLIGRFFRSNAESHIRTNLTIFVTADIIDPAGKPVRNRNTDAQSAGAASAAPGLFPEDGLVTP